MSAATTIITDKMDQTSFNSDLCSLCFNYKTESLRTTEMSDRIEKYLHIKMEYSSNGICLSCFNSIEAFHEFYRRVHDAHRNLQQSLMPVRKQVDKELSTETFKTEEDSPNNITQVKEVIRDSSNTIGFMNVDNQTENICTKAEKHTPEESFKKTDYDKSKRTSKMLMKEGVCSDIEQKMLNFYNIKCEKCEDSEFTSFKMLSRHYRTVHNKQGYIKCCKRNIRVNDKYYLRNHMFKHLQPDSCRCKVCGKELSSLVTLKHHMNLHKPEEERPFQCSHCKKSFCCKNDLNNHEKAIHVPENERQDFICDMCGKVFQRVATLKYHLSTVHLQDRKYICEICAKCFTTPSGLRTHINAVHSLHKPIQCHKCQKWLKTTGTFQKHLQLHQNNTYPCSHCDKVCKSSTSLRSHLVKHSEKRPYSCENHSAQHNAGSGYKCPDCPKLFVNMSNYYTHKKRMHSSEKVKNCGEDQQVPSQKRCQVPEQMFRNDVTELLQPTGKIETTELLNCLT
ncbi:hypothetical protein RUM44_010183 [Polyplax serrata]|uniref:Uncharacterized protein n=1 Tax=Polyplax serrata TaxID=468196 RepID=A0ABR1AUT4_POLSC